VMSGEGKRSHRPSLDAAAPFLDSTTRDYGDSAVY
jgi:hypothetical protein